MDHRRRVGRLTFKQLMKNLTIRFNLFSNFLGNLKNSDDDNTVYKGKFEVPNLSEEHSPNDVDVREFYFRNCFVFEFTLQNSNSGFI